MELMVAHVGKGRAGDRTIRVFVDDEERAEVRCGQWARLELESGSHAIRIENEANTSDTLLVSAQGRDLRLEGGLSWTGAGRLTTIWNVLWRGPELDLRPSSAQELRVSLLERTRRSTASRRLLGRVFVDGAVTELKTFLWFAPLAAFAAAIWIILRDRVG